MDVSDEAADAEEGANAGEEESDDGPATEEPFEVIQSSLIVLDPTALDAINPHFTDDVEQMPIVRMELMSDLVIDVEFLNAKPRWTFEAAASENEEEAGGSGLEPVEDGFLIRGTILPPHSGYVVLRARDAGLFGVASVDDVGRFEIHRENVPFHTVNKYQFAEWGCGVEEEIADEAMGMMGDGTLMGGEGSGTMPTGCPGGCDDGCTIDVMILYTQAALDYVAGQSRDIDVEIETRISAVNSIIEISTIVPRGTNLLRLVYTGLAYGDDGEPYVENGMTTEEVISEFRSLNNVEHIRNVVRADLVSIWVSGIGGLNYAYIPKSFSLTTERLDAYSIVRPSTPAETVTHEFGHNFGCRHDHFANCGCDCEEACGNESCGNCPASIQPFAYGWHFPIEVDEQEEYRRTIMAYAPPNECIANAPRIQRFSGAYYPDEQSGWPTGEAGCADNVLTVGGDEINYGTRFLVAQHRTSHDTSNTTEMIRGREDLPPDFNNVVLNHDSESPSVSSNGRYVLFSSRADNFPGGFSYLSTFDRNVYLNDRETGLVTLATYDRSNPNTAADDESFHPAISGNGSLLTFTSNATNLVDPPINPEQHVWTRPRGSGGAFVVSRASGQQGAIGNGPSDHPAASHDGQIIAFQSESTNLVVGDNNGVTDIFVRNRLTDATVRVSVDSSGSEANGASEHPAISADGVYVAYESIATSLVNNDNNDARDIFIRNVVTSETQRVSIPHPGHNDAESNGDSFAPSISEDGNRIAFHSEATNLVDPNITIHSGHSNVYVYDRAAEEMILVSECVSAGASGTQSSMLPSISPDGRFVAFLSYAKNLLDGENCTDASGLYRQVLVRDLEEGVTYHISVDDQALPADASCHHVSISDNGRFVSYSSLASNLTPEADGSSHVFIRDRGIFPCGDLNGDGIVDNDDLAILELHMGYECSVADLNGDGVVDQCDFDILYAAMQGPPSQCGDCNE